MSEPAPSPSPVLLDARVVRKEFGGLVAVNDLDFNIPPQSGHMTSNGWSLSPIEHLSVPF